jgi:histidine kinase
MDLFKADEKDLYVSRINTETVINQVKQLTKTGRTIYVDIWVSPAEYEWKKVFLVTTSDITQRLETEQQLIQAGKMATLGEMATGVAHELNQPLSVIKTASSFCIKKINQDEKIQPEALNTMLNKIDSNVDRATKIITHMRQFARKDDLKLVRIQINDVIGRAFEIFSQQLRLRGIEVVCDLDRNLPEIRGDSDRLEQVFINLLINARDALEEKWGPKDSQPAEKKITFRSWSKERHVFIEVCDTGSGIPEGVADKIFEPFFTTKEVGKGTGIGLSISYGIVKDCAGTIQVKSTSPEGTCFILKFPLEEK